MAMLWFLAAAIERFTYPLRYDGEIRAAEVVNLKGECSEISGDTMIAWRLTSDRRSVEYKCPASRPWPFYATTKVAGVPMTIQRSVAKTSR